MTVWGLADGGDRAVGGRWRGISGAVGGRVWGSFWAVLGRDEFISKSGGFGKGVRKWIGNRWKVDEKGIGNGWEMDGK